MTLASETQVRLSANAREALILFESERSRGYAVSARQHLADAIVLLYLIEQEA